MDFKKNYYQILGIAKNATADEIKSAYRTLAKKYHPDLNPNNPECEELIKEINEAYEVLSNNDNRFVYDHYKATEPAADKPKPKEKPKPNTKNRRSYTKKVVITTEEKIYVKGRIFIKYRGKQDNDETTDILKEVVYNLHITEVKARINAQDIYREDFVPAEYREAFAGEKLAIRVPQPIKLEVTYPSDLAHYELEVFDLAIKALTYDNVTKDDGDSYGSLQGEFYGYIKHITKHEEETIVTECYGETGRVEHKTENGAKFHRREYFKNDCTTYWGNWIPEYVAPPVRPKTAAMQAGCLPSLVTIYQSAIVLFFLFYFLAKLSLIIPFLVIGGLFWLLSARLWNWFFRALGLIVLVLFIFALIGAFNKPPMVIPVAKDKPQELKPRKTPIRNSKTDSLITYYRSWTDYDGKLYRGKYSVRKSAFINAKNYKNSLDDDGNYDQLLYNLKENDQEKLTGLYHLLDSIKTKNNLSAETFAECVVAMVQDIPYAVVLPQDCDPSLYADKFISKYLVSANAHCDGNEKFGINTPVEFLATLNGDCDTRTLLLYTVLAHYDYDVALLSSEHYSHSILGINLPYGGTSYDKYVLWETTSIIKPGILPNEIADLNYWRISLKSKP
jgi:curved DNA-binding protein CbpA